MTILKSEYEAFSRLADGLAQAADGARLMARYQPDKGHMWQKMAETIEVCKTSVYKLSEESVMKQLNETRN
jgi:hypothetical protein